MKKWLSFECCMTIVMVVVPGIITAVFFSLYLVDITEDKKFKKEAIQVSGEIVGQSTCRDGSRFGHQYCYRVRFTTLDGEEVDFSAAGRTSYTAGLYILPNSVSVEYLPENSVHARLVGAESNTGIFLIGSLLGGGITIFVAFSMFFADQFRRKSDEIQEEINGLLLSGNIDDAICLAKSIDNDVRRKILLTDLVVKLYEYEFEERGGIVLDYLLSVFEKESSSFQRDSMLHTLASKLSEVKEYESASRVVGMIEHKDVKRISSYMV
ncbi:DUF3592 domain-containing protein [Vreelandella populi]|uniref:DUF3592 domain-containing protein n=1 Tax=Vreelandella populi TaxID=2498858 RepID=UPI000F8E12C2|nr:DUF3592 domain-containing protein [Halomonas populi]RUR56588.1 DUF3592 domain-containing protein [Halomonas populi]